MGVYQKGLLCVSFSIYDHHASVIQHKRGDGAMQKVPFSAFAGPTKQSLRFDLR
jgi:hypothetical protein